MAEGLLFGVAEGIVEKLGSSALREIGLWWGVRDEIELLRIKVDGVKGVLFDAEGRQARPDDPLERWLGKLKEVVYDADDLLDDFSTEVLRRQVMTGNKVAKEVRLFFSSSNRVAYGLKMGHKIKAIRERLDAVMRVGKQFNFQQRLVDTSTSVMAKERGQTHSSVPEVVVGREVEKNKITQLLLSDNYETNVAVVSIVGIGGLGKTTLAQLAYNDENVKSQFQLRMWVCVSDDFDVKLIVEKILERVSEKRSDVNQMNTLKNSLHEKINGKKYLLVLDDVWNDDAKEWDSLRDLLVGGSRGSRILVTTRSKKVAKITSLPQSRYELTGLSNEKSWSLFAQVAFEQGCAPPSFEEIGKEIVAKCKGVPLSIRVIGRLLYLKETIAEWELFKSKELTEMDQGESRIMATLKLSYDHLPSHLKHCFAYCRLFPKDYEIDVDEVVDLWMAQGYIKLSSDQSSQCLEDVGRECFMDLLWRSFFQDVEKDVNGNVMSCKMHDLMHDLASSVAGAESAYVLISNPIEVDAKTRHISFDPSSFRYSDTWQVPVSVLEAKSLRTFLGPAGGYWKLGEGQCHAIFCKLRRLRQLDLLGLGIETVPHSIGKLKQLRYLDLSWSREIKMLPRSITRLQNLQVLKLEQCETLRQLPKDIKKLVSLKKLDIHGCSSLTHMPRGIGQLTSLERLTRFILPKSKKEESGSGGLGELHNLNKLGGRLWIENLSHHGNGRGDANLREKPRLQVLQLNWVDLDGDNDIDINEDEMSLKALWPHPNLKALTVLNYGGMKFANWLSSLTNLVSLELYDCSKCRSLPALDQLSSLKEVRIAGLTDLEYIDIDIDIRSCCAVGGGGSAFFPSLETMRLYNCPNLKGWRPSSPSSSSSLLPQFQCLSCLSIESCPNLTSMPAFSPSLNKLFITSVSFKSLEQMLRGTISPAHEPSSSSLPSILSSSSLKQLWIDGIEHLPEDFLPVELLQTLTSLEHLNIRSCPTLTCLPQMLLLTSLKSLWISHCENLDLSNYDDDSNSNNNDAILWQGQGLRSLTDLGLDGIPKLVHLPKRLLLHSILLQYLYIENCPNLASLPEWMPNLTSLQNLTISRCENLDLSNYDDDSNSNNNDAILWRGQGLRSLTYLKIWDIPKLVHLPKRLLLHSVVLQHLLIYSCPNLASLPEWMPNLTSLQNLTISHCENLDLSNYDDDSNSNNNDAILWQGQGLRSLTSLEIWGIPKLVHLPRRLLLHSIVLQRLQVHYCPNLASLPEWMPNLTSLQSLTIKSCSQLSERCKNMGEDWPKIAHIPNIEVDDRHIQRDGCYQL